MEPTGAMEHCVARPARAVGRSRCPGLALGAVTLALAGTTTLLASCLAAAAGFGIVGAIGAACVVAVFAVVLAIVSLSVLAAIVHPGMRRRRGSAGPPLPAGCAAGGRDGAAPCFTGILSGSGRYWPFGRASPRRAGAG